MSVQVKRSEVIDTKTGQHTLDSIRTSYGAAIMCVIMNQRYECYIAVMPYRCNQRFKSHGCPVRGTQHKGVDVGQGAKLCNGVNRRALR